MPNRFQRVQRPSGPLFSRRQLNWIIYGVAIAIILLSATGRQDPRDALQIAYQQDQGMRLYRMQPASDERELRLLFRAGWHEAPAGVARGAFEHLRQHLNRDPTLQQLLRTHGVRPLSDLNGERALLGLRWNPDSDPQISNLIAQLGKVIAAAVESSPDPTLIRRLTAEAALIPSPEQSARQALRGPLLPPGSGERLASGAAPPTTETLRAFLTAAYGSLNLVLTLQAPHSVTSLAWLAELGEALPAGRPLPPIHSPAQPTPRQDHLSPTRSVENAAIFQPKLLLMRLTEGRLATDYPRQLLAEAVLQHRMPRLGGAQQQLHWLREAHFGVLELSLEGWRPSATTSPQPEPNRLLPSLLQRLAQPLDPAELEQAKARLLADFKVQRQSLEGRGDLLEQVATSGLSLALLSEFEITIANLATSDVEPLLEQLLNETPWSYRYLVPLE